MSLVCDVKSPKKKCINTDMFDESIIKMLPGDDNVIEIKSSSNRHESIQKSIM